MYVQAAEDFLHIGRVATAAAGSGEAGEKMRAACMAEVAKALERAEKIKGVRKDVNPVAKDHFSIRECNLWIVLIASLTMFRTVQSSSIMS